MSSKNKKILYVITKGNFGGAQRYVFDLATHLSKGTFDIVVACGDKDGNALSQKLAEQNIRTITLENSGREINLKNDFKTIKELIKIIKLEKPDIVHLNSSKIGLLGGFAILYLKILNLFRISGFEFRVCSIFTAHGWAFNEPGRSAISKFIFYLGHYFTILICDTTIAVSEKAKRDVDWLPFIENKIKVIYNGILKFETLPKEESRLIIAGKDSNNPSTSSGQAIIFSISELHQNKGIDTALKALAILPKEARNKIIYSVAGDGEKRESLEKLVSELGISDMVRFLGFVPQASKLLSGADFFLLPSRTEALPYAVLEAGLAGKPIIATNVGGVSEIIHDMQNGILVHAKNPKEIAEAILYYLDHPEKQKEFGEEIKKTITNFFSLERMLSETIRTYKN